MKIVSVVMLFTPVGVFCSIASVVYANGTETILALGTVLIALYLTFFLYFGRNRPSRLANRVVPV